MSDQGTEKNPLVMKMLPGDPPGAAAFARMVIFTVAPVAIAILMQKPALRQAIVMRAALESQKLCQTMADFWSDLALKSATAYQKARM